jgi:hypothetical protein
MTLLIGTVLAILVWRSAPTVVIAVFVVTLCVCLAFGEPIGSRSYPRREDGQ